MVLKSQNLSSNPWDMPINFDSRPKPTSSEVSKKPKKQSKVEALKEDSKNPPKKQTEPEKFPAPAIAQKLEIQVKKQT